MPDIVPSAGVDANGVAAESGLELRAMELSSGDKVGFLQKIGAQQAPLLALPAGQRWSPPGLTLFASASRYSISPDPSGPYRVWGIARIFVDLTNVTGVASDANAGTTQAQPLATLSAARAKVNTNGTEIICFGHKQDVVVKETASWTAGVGFDYRMVNRELPFRISLLRVANAAAPTWAATNGQPGVYETTIAAADAASLVDMANKVDMAARVQVPVGGTVADQVRYQNIVRNTPPAWNVPVLVGSIAAVAAQPGSRFHDGTKLYVQAVDSRNLVGDTRMLPLTNGVFARTATNAPNRIQHFKGFDVIGGAVPWFVTTGSDTVFGCIYVFEDCSTQASASGGAGGFQVTGVARVLLIRCAAWFNWSDGFNYHSFTTGNLNAGPFILEFQCAAGGNGTTGSAGTSDNDSTAHEKTDVTSVDCVFVGSSDRVVADIDDARRLLLGGYIGAPIDSNGVSLANLATANTAQTVVYGTQFATPGANAVVMRAEGSSLIATNDTPAALSRSGNVA